MASELSLWLAEHLDRLTLDGDAYGYLLGRGGRPAELEVLKIKEWETARTPAPSAEFRKRYGSRGEALRDHVVIPLLSPLGDLLGIEARSYREKKISEFRCPEAAWNPVCIGAPGALKAMWEGGSVWVAEGVYDMMALGWALPQGDAAVATLRAGLAASTVQFFARYCTANVYMVYDNDPTGRKATHGWVDEATGKYRRGALQLLKAAGVRALDYPYRGKDPGEVWSAGGREALLREFGLR